MKLDPAHWRALSELLDQALDLEDGERAAWLSTLSGDAAELRPLLSDLLAQRARAETGDFIDTLPRFDALPDPAQPEQTAGSLVGPYRLVRVLGRGGMGEVWLAERADGLLRRPVALKLPLLALSRGALAERFARERDVLASLTHAHIARLYDAGFAADGQPYLALEYVDGVPITTYADGHALGIDARLALFAQVLDAVAHAHATLVLHRDLKPSNILVTPQGDVKLLDFGIAKLLTDGEAGETELTRVAGNALTLDYASPEQIAGAPLTTAADVYALGVVLYELLTGERPYRLRHGSRGELEDAIAMVDPLAPSRARIGEAAATARGMSVAKLRRRLAGDLDTIVAKALRKEPGARYGGAVALADDLARHRDDLPIDARRQAAWYTFRRFVRRHAVAVAAGSTVAVALMAATIVSLSLLQRADQAAERARAEAAVAHAVQTFLSDLFSANGAGAASLEQTRSMTAEQLLERGAAKIERELDGAPKAKAALLKLFGEMYEELDRYPQALAMHERSVAQTRAVYGEVSREYALALLEHAWVWHRLVSGPEPLGEMDRAREVLARVAPDSEDYAEALYMRVEMLYYSRPDEAVAAGEQSVRIMERLHATGRRATFAKSALAKAYRWQGNLEAATRWYEAARADYLRDFGPTFADLIDTRTELAALYRMQLRFAEAEAETRAAFAAADDRSAGGTGVLYYRRLDLGAILLARGRLGEAREQFALAERGAQQSHDGSPFTNVLQMRAYRAGLEIGIGDVDWSVKTLETVLAAPDGVSDRSLIPTFAVMEQLARGHLLAGNVARASELAAKADAIVRERGAPPFRALGVAALLAEIRALRGDPQGGWDDLATARTRYPLVAAMRAPRLTTDLSAARIAALRGAWGDVETSLTEWLQDPPPGVELPAHARGEALVLAGEAALHADRSRARRLLEQGRDALERIDPPVSPWHARVRNDLAELASSAH